MTIRPFRLLAAITATTALILAAGSAAEAAPLDSGSAAGSSNPGPQRSAADRQFLHDAYLTNESYDYQDAAIGLAHADCQYLDDQGNTASNRIYLAENSKDAVEYPYIFLHAGNRRVLPLEPDVSASAAPGWPSPAIAFPAGAGVTPASGGVLVEMFLRSIAVNGFRGIGPKTTLTLQSARP